jgi:hypothetical protein
MASLGANRMDSARFGPEERAMQAGRKLAVLLCLVAVCCFSGDSLLAQSQEDMQD